MKSQRIGQIGIKNGTYTAKSANCSVFKVLLKEAKEGDMNVAIKEYMLPSGKEDEEKRSLVEGSLTFLLEDFEKVLMPLAPHPNVARYYGIEYLPGIANGNLDRIMLTVDWIEAVPLKGPLPENQVRDIISDVLKGLAHLHKAGITHDNISINNVMVTNIWRRRPAGQAADKPIAVLTDYSLFKRIREIIDPEGGNATLARPAQYLAPEAVVDAKDYDTMKADMWAVGALAVELLAGAPAYSELGKGVQIMKIVMSGKPPKYAEGISAPAKQFLDALFDRNFRARPSADEALTFGWMQAAN